MAVLAIIITIMVLELKSPEGSQFTALASTHSDILKLCAEFHLYRNLLEQPSSPVAYDTARERRNSLVKLASPVLAFSLSFHDGMDGWYPCGGPAPTALYGLVLLFAAIAYYILQCAILANDGRTSILADALGRDWKGKLSPVIYLAAIPLAFVSPWIANGMYAFVALLWVVPDRRIERALRTQEHTGAKENEVTISAQGRPQPRHRRFCSAVMRL